MCSYITHLRTCCLCTEQETILISEKPCSATKKSIFGSCGRAIKNRNKFNKSLYQCCNCRHQVSWVVYRPSLRMAWHGWLPDMLRFSTNQLGVIQLMKSYQALGKMDEQGYCITTSHDRQRWRFMGQTDTRMAHDANDGMKSISWRAILCEGKNRGYSRENVTKAPFSSSAVWPMTHGELEL